MREPWTWRNCSIYGRVEIETGWVEADAALILTPTTQVAHIRHLLGECGASPTAQNSARYRHSASFLEDIARTLHLTFLMSECWTELTGRVLVLVAHADDESIGYGALLQRMRESVVVIATDGAPQDRFFWESFGSREAYAAVRREEARRATQLVGVRELLLLAKEDSRLEDQRLFLNLAAAYSLLEKVMKRVRPEAIATLAYEGGHPDHDSCSILGARLGKEFGVPVWEAPLYSRGSDGAMRLQRFLCETGSECAVDIADGELERKREMCAQYVSQGNFLLTFDARREMVRPQAKYDYARPPHEGVTNYELWRWWMSAADVSAKFAEFLEIDN